MSSRAHSTPNPPGGSDSAVVRKYVVAFNRDRDFYQVPVALAEAGKLASLQTDLYIPDFLAGNPIVKAAKLSHRRHDLLPSQLVNLSPKVLWLQMAELRFAKSDTERSSVFQKVDSHLSHLAAREARRSGAGLLLYSGYALEAFEMLREEAIPKLLFVFHPQGDYVRQILVEDFEKHPEVAASHQRHLEEVAVLEGERVRQEISLATGIACASNFTAASIRAALGTKTTKVSVVPYGCYSPPTADESLEGWQRSKPRLLFVGQGTQRKGLHHLLKVWRRGLDKISDLTLVLNQTDPGIARLIDALPVKPTVVHHLSRKALEDEFKQADVFVLPSLVEGFGLVYLEALAAGCHVIGTTNTGLPDLGAPEEIATVVPAGCLESLETAIAKAISNAEKGFYQRSKTRLFASEKGWSNFRHGIREFVANCEPKAGRAKS